MPTPGALRAAEILTGCIASMREQERTQSEWAELIDETAVADERLACAQIAKTEADRQYIDGDRIYCNGWHTAARLIAEKICERNPHAVKEASKRGQERETPCQPLDAVKQTSTAAGCPACAHYKVAMPHDPSTRKCFQCGRVVQVPTAAPDREEPQP